jgi:hypothetical protein
MRQNVDTKKQDSSLKSDNNKDFIDQIENDIQLPKFKRLWELISALNRAWTKELKDRKLKGKKIRQINAIYLYGGAVRDEIINHDRRKKIPIRDHDIILFAPSRFAADLVGPFPGLFKPYTNNDLLFCLEENGSIIEIAFYFPEDLDLTEEELLRQHFEKLDITLNATAIAIDKNGKKKIHYFSDAINDIRNLLIRSIEPIDKVFGQPLQYENAAKDKIYKIMRMFRIFDLECKYLSHDLVLKYANQEQLVEEINKTVNQLKGFKDNGSLYKKIYHGFSKGEAERFLQRLDHYNIASYIFPHFNLVKEFIYAMVKEIDSYHLIPTNEQLSQHVLYGLILWPSFYLNSKNELRQKINFEKFLNQVTDKTFSQSIVSLRSSDAKIKNIFNDIYLLPSSNTVFIFQNIINQQNLKAGEEAHMRASHAKSKEEQETRERERAKQAAILKKELEAIENEQAKQTAKLKEEQEAKEKERANQQAKLKEEQEAKEKERADQEAQLKEKKEAAEKEQAARKAKIKADRDAQKMELAKEEAARIARKLAKNERKKQEQTEKNKENKKDESQNKTEVAVEENVGFVETEKAVNNLEKDTKQADLEKQARAREIAAKKRQIKAVFERERIKKQQEEVARKEQQKIIKKQQKKIREQETAQKAIEAAGAITKDLQETFSSAVEITKTELDKPIIQNEQIVRQPKEFIKDVNEKSNSIPYNLKNVKQSSHPLSFSENSFSRFFKPKVFENQHNPYLYTTSNFFKGVYLLPAFIYYGAIRSLYESGSILDIASFAIMVSFIDNALFFVKKTITAPLPILGNKQTTTFLSKRMSREDKEIRKKLQDEHVKYNQLAGKINHLESRLIEQEIINWSITALLPAVMMVIFYYQKIHDSEINFNVLLDNTMILTYAWRVMFQFIDDYVVNKNTYVEHANLMNQVVDSLENIASVKSDLEEKSSFEYK